MNKGRLENFKLSHLLFFTHRDRSRSTSFRAGQRLCWLLGSFANSVWIKHDLVWFARSLSGRIDGTAACFVLPSIKSFFLTAMGSFWWFLWNRKLPLGEQASSTADGRANRTTKLRRRISPSSHGAVVPSLVIQWHSSPDYRASAKCPLHLTSIAYSHLYYRCRPPTFAPSNRRGRCCRPH